MKNLLFLFNTALKAIVSNANAITSITSVSTTMASMATVLFATASVAKAELSYSPLSLSTAQVISEMEKIQLFVLSMADVNGISMTACEEKTGTPFYLLLADQVKTSLFVNCINIFTKTETASSSLRTLYPPGSKYQGIYINVEYAGPIVFE